MRELLRRLHYLLHRRPFDDELAAETAAHRETAERAGGVPLGNVLLLREESREAWGLMWSDRLGQNLRCAFRAMRASPGFATAAILVLAIGIGATVAAFPAFNMVVLRPLPVRDPDSILRFARQALERATSESPYPAVAFYREHTRTLSPVLAETETGLRVDGLDCAASTTFVTANFFDELGAQSKAGRLFTAGDDRPDAQWRRGRRKLAFDSLSVRTRATS